MRQTTTSVTVEDPNPIRCLVYIGLPSNPQFLGPQDPAALAKKILDSKGPSGENREYLFNLEAALTGLSKESSDAHVSDLVKRCRALEGNRLDTGGKGKQVGDEQEEVEK
jgi:cation transport protein ChaC